MFDIGWSELVVIGVVALIAIGPKELPGVLRMVGQWMGKARKMASEFQGQFNEERWREAEMADLKKTFDDVRGAARDLKSNNIMTSMQKDATEALRIEDLTPAASDDTGAADARDLFRGRGDMKRPTRRSRSRRRSFTRFKPRSRSTSRRPRRRRRLLRF